MSPPLSSTHQQALNALAAEADENGFLVYVRYMDCGEYSQAASYHLVPKDTFGETVPSNLMLPECMDPLWYMPIDPDCGEVPFAYWE